MSIPHSLAFLFPLKIKDGAAVNKVYCSLRADLSNVSPMDK